MLPLGEEMETQNIRLIMRKYYGIPLKGYQVKSPGTSIRPRGKVFSLKQLNFRWSADR